MAFGGGQDVGAFGEAMLDDVRAMAKGVMSDIVGEDEVAFVK